MIWCPCRQTAWAEAAFITQTSIFTTSTFGGGKENGPAALKETMDLKHHAMVADTENQMVWFLNESRKIIKARVIFVTVNKSYEI